jgi:cell fate (sporulation/competence/biofilm development) regulator YmcA (YheA/YmcA/DUF963 family)
MRQLPPTGKAESRPGKKSRIEASWLRIKKTKKSSCAINHTDKFKTKKAVQKRVF